MLTAALFALSLAVAAPPETPQPTLPLSPASLPPPPPPKVDPATATFNINFSLKFGEAGGKIDECLLKSLGVISGLEAFQFGEITEGAILGYTDTRRVAILAVPRRENCAIYVMSVSTNQECDQFGEGIITRIEKAVLDPAKPKQAGKRNLDLEKKLPPLTWHIETKPALKLTQHFSGVAGVVLEKNGYSAQVLPPRGDINAAMGFKDGAKKQMALVSMLEGVNGISKNYLIFCTGTEAAIRDAKTLSTAILKIMYE